MSQQTANPMRRWLKMASAITVGVVIAVGVWYYFGPHFEKQAHERTPPNVPTGAIGEKLQAFRELNRAKDLAVSGKHEEAIAIYSAVIEREGDSPFGWNANVHAALSEAHLGRHDTGLDRVERVIAQCKIEDEIVTARRVKASINSLAGRDGIAVGMLHALVDEYADLSPRYCADALFTLARLHERAGRHALQIASLNRIAVSFPGSEGTFQHRAQRQEEHVTTHIRQMQQSATDAMVAEGPAKIVEALSAGETLWVAADGPYLLTSTVVVEDGAVLRIEAGTVILATVEGGIEVRGSLIASGQASRPIWFSSLDGQGAQNWWGGIRGVRGVRAAGGESKPSVQLSHCRITGAGRGVSADGGQLTLDDCTIERSTLEAVAARSGTQLTMNRCQVFDALVGISCESRSLLIMNDCRITAAGSHGLLMQDVGEASSVRATTIEAGKGAGIIVRGRGGLTVDDCTVQDNVGHGIYSLDAASPKIVGSVIVQNGGSGIRIEQQWDQSIARCHIAGNGGGGITVEGRCRGEIQSNLIERNNEAGVRLRLGSTTRLIGNRIVDNLGVGLMLAAEAVPGELYENHFVGNRDGGLHSDSSSSIDAANNWWGTKDGQAIAAMVHVSGEGESSKNVQYEPWLVSEPTFDGPGFASD